MEYFDQHGSKQVVLYGADGNPLFAVPPQLDDTDKLAVSLYGKGTVAGDTPLKVDAARGLYVGQSNLNRALADGYNNTVNGFVSGGGALLDTAVFLHLFNGVTWDRWRNNHEVTALASAARTASVNSADLVNYNGRGVIVVIDVTAIVDTPSITVTISGKDTLSGKYVALLGSAALVGTGTTALIVYPGITAVANAKVDQPLPRVWRVEVVAADADSITYSIGANYIV